MQEQAFLQKVQGQKKKTTSQENGLISTEETTFRQDRTLTCLMTTAFSVIGTIKKISSDASLITITNTDGKDETFALTPFTKICIPPERALNQQAENPDQKPELPPPPCSTAADLQKDDWVIVKTAATDTKTPVAGIIFVSKKTVEKK